MVGGEFGTNLALGLRGTLCRCHQRSALGLGRSGVVVIEQDRRERLAHVPFHTVGQHAQQDVGAHPLLKPMVNRTELEVDLS